MNEIIYSCAKLDDPSALRDENEIIQSVFRCINEIFSIVRPRKLLYMAIDGVAPKAKMHNQRAGLFRYAENPPSEDEQFTKCDIKPGTKFMSKLSADLQHYIYKRMNEDSAWKSIIVILSDANAPGEGEHKIMDFIQTMFYLVPILIWCYLV
jgi:5'-3' exoribonuclease 2